MSGLDDEPYWVGGRLSLGCRVVRATLLFLLFAMPAMLVPEVVWETRLGWAGLGLLLAVGVLVIPGRGMRSCPPPVYDIIYAALIPVWLVALVGVNAWHAVREAPGLLAGAGGLIGFRFGPLWTSTLPETLSDTHGACLLVSLILVVLAAVRVLTMRWPTEADRAWALSFRAGRAVEVSRMKKQKIVGTGALRNIAIGLGALYFPLKESFATEMIALGEILPVTLGLFLLLALKCAAVVSLLLLGVAILKIGLSERESMSEAITGRKSRS
ncbi:MAG: hypothetical protein AAFU49_16330 [Pseudomonadota bacterium]